jgi:hypothetical protein
MTDTELDRLLNSWPAPEPPRSLRRDLRARFPRRERQNVRGPLRWALVAALASGVIAVGMQQITVGLSSHHILEVFSGWYDAFVFGLQAHRYATLAIQIRDSDPRVTIDGQPGPPLRPGHAMSFELDIPGDGVYSIVAGDLGEKGWTRAGRVEGSALRFDAGSHHVVVECGERLLIGDAPVLVRRR